MNCEHYSDHIADLVDGTLGAARRDELDRHLAECPSCRAVVADLREIRAVSARLAVHKPPERVWQQIARRLPDVLQERERDKTAFSLSAWLRSAVTMPRLAWSGALAVALAAAVFFVAVPRLRPTSAPQLAATHGPAGTQPTPAVHAGGRDLVQSVESELQEAERHYQNAIGGLEQMAKAGESTLDPQLATWLLLGIAYPFFNATHTGVAPADGAKILVDVFFDGVGR